MRAASPAAAGEPGGLARDVDEDVDRPGSLVLYEVAEHECGADHEDAAWRH
jgi:hypothetical protein